MTATEWKSDFELTTDTPYFTLKGELWGVYYKHFEENWPRYNGTTLEEAEGPILAAVIITMAADDLVTQGARASVRRVMS